MLSAVRFTVLRALFVADRSWDCALEILLNKLLLGKLVWLVFGPLPKLELPNPLLGELPEVPTPLE